MRSGSAGLAAGADARARSRAGDARARAARRPGPDLRAAVAAAGGAGPGRVTLEGIAAELEARGVPAPGGGGRWSAVAVARVLGALARPWRRLSGGSGAGLPPHRSPAPAHAPEPRR